MALRAATVMKRAGLVQRLTGLSVAECAQVLPAFTHAYQQQVIQPRLAAPTRVRGLGGGQKGALPEVADKLLFILVYVRVYPLLFVQGMLFGMAESKACTWVKILLPVLDATLAQQYVRPHRATGRSLEEIIAEFPELTEMGILIDGTERPVHRPKEATQQKAAYSGKKKRHTKKHVTITHPTTQYILAVSAEASGSRHDKKLLDDAQMSCTSALLVQADTGFQGLSIGQAIIRTPHKRKRTKRGDPKDELTPVQKAHNTELAKARIAIEHSNAGFKRNRSISEVLRNTREGTSDLLAVIAMGLHNLRVLFRASYQMA